MNSAFHDAASLAALEQAGATAASEGRSWRSNPYLLPQPMPDAPGHPPGDRARQRDAWRRGFDGRRLALLRDAIREAEDALRGLRGDIARLEAGAGFSDTVRLLVAENERLQGELDASRSRATLEADSAHAALRDAIRASETDPLTQLPNRTVLFDRLGHDLAVARRQGSRLTVLFLDLDGFKAVNDTLGHDAGDHLLRHVANALRRAVRESDTVCRLGGDEFVVVAAGIAPRELPALQGKLADAVAAPCEWGGHRMSARVSIGTGSYPEDGDRADTLLHHADAAMYRAKQGGGPQGA